MMDNVNPSALMISSGFSDPVGPHFVSANMNQLHPSVQQGWASACGPVAIFWDIENCPVPSDVRPEDVAGNIRMALQVHPVVKGAVTVFSAYGDFNAFPRRLREGCQRTGIKLIDVPNGRKDAADKAILIDMFLFALDNRPPSSIMLISGDVDFAPALHILGQRGYSVILAIPSNVGVSSALSNAGRFLWDWPSVVRGEGFLPPAKALNFHRIGSADIAAYMVGCTLGESTDCQNEEESILYKGISQGYYNSKDLSIMSHSVAEYNCTSSMNMPCFPASLRSQSLPVGLNEVSGGSTFCPDWNESSSWVQPGDLNGLKGQLVKLLELSGGSLPLARVPCEYQKIYGRPLYVSEYGVCKLVNLFKKMSGTMAIEGIGKGKVVYLRNVKAGASSPPVNLARKDAKGKESRDDCTLGSSDECSEDGKAGEEEGRIIEEESSLQKGDEGVDDNRFIEEFKRELQEILVSYSCQIFLNCFEAIYQQRYKKQIDYQRFGTSKLEELFDKVRDVVALHEEPVSKKKFLTAVGG